MALKAVNIKRTMPDYKDICEIYKSSFPKAEQFPIWLLRVMSHLKGIHSVSFYDDDILCGFSYFLENEKTVFILFLAVNGKVRSKGYGSRILSQIKELHPGKTIFLDVEKPDEKAENNHQRLKRIEFYRRNGIVDTNNSFTYDGITYEILSTDKNFSEQEYTENLESYLRIFKRRKAKR